MTKIKIPILVQDPQLATVAGLAVAEGYYAQEPDFTNGPACARVKIIDRNPDDQAFLPGARYYPPPAKRRTGGYLTKDGKDIEQQVKLTIRSGDREAIESLLCTDEFIQVSVFSTVLKTLGLFEKKEIMGRQIGWAFGDQPLEVYPRARTGLNALYHRPSHNLRFFYQDYPPQASGAAPRRVYTCLSLDVITHETGHAILDGIEPALLDAIGPHPRALHEGLADLISVLIAFKSGTLSKFVLSHHYGSILEATAFSDIAELIGPLLNSGDAPLRAVINTVHLDPERPAGYARPDQPYEVCLALSGALYHILQQHHKILKETLAETVYRSYPDPHFSASGQALMDSARYLRSNIFRALDFLPPGEISLADYGRALCAVHYISYPEDTLYRDWICQEFFQRRMINDPGEIEFQPPEQPAYTQPINKLFADDLVARQFVEHNRAWIGIPDGQEFEVRPRLKAAPQGLRSYCILKVLWESQEPNQMSSEFPAQRWIRVGSTVVFDWATGQVLARLSCAPPTPTLYPDPHIRQLASQSYQRRQADTDCYLIWLKQNGMFRQRSLEQRPLGLDELPSDEAVCAEFEGEAMHARGTGLGLHSPRPG